MKSLTILAVVVCLLAFEAASLPVHATGEARKSAVRGLTETQLKNATAYAPDEGESAGMHPVKFKSGVHTDGQQQAGILKVAVGDLNGDHINDGAIVFYESGGGSGEFMRMSVFVCKDGKPVQIGWRGLGDRSGTNSLKIRNEVLTLDIWTHGGSDPANSPSVHRVIQFRVRGNKLIGPDDIQ